jgi:hypothetical protein
MAITGFTPDPNGPSGAGMRRAPTLMTELATIAPLQSARVQPLVKAPEAVKR